MADAVRLTMAQALLRHLTSYESEIDGTAVPLFAGVFAIFGHGNVTCLGEALQQTQDRLPTWRGQNEQSMALAAIGFAKARRRRQMMVVSSSIGPGATNMVTAAALAHVNRLPILILAGDVFANRLPDPVLQQIENFANPTITANDCFKPVSRYWDRITHPEQLLSSLPQAVATLLDAGDCGPAFLGLCQDTQERAYDYPQYFFAKKTCRLLRSRPDRQRIKEVTELLQNAQRPLVICGGGVRYSFGEDLLAEWLLECRIPIVETPAGRSAILAEHPCNLGALGVIGSRAANAVAEKADLILAIGTRLQDFTIASGSLFNEKAKIISLNAARFDAVKRCAVALVADAREGLEELREALKAKGGYTAPKVWQEQARKEREVWQQRVADHIRANNSQPPSYGQVIGCINDIVEAEDLVVAAAGGLPGEVNALWRSLSTNSVDCEFGYSCMGYEIAGAWGAAMARKLEKKEGKKVGEVIVFCGDGSYLMMNSELYSSVLTGHKIILILCDNNGFAVIDRLQRAKGGVSFNNLLKHTRRAEAVLKKVDFVSHARSLGCEARKVTNLGELANDFLWAKSNQCSTVLVIATHEDNWAPQGEAWWDVGVPEVSERKEVLAARDEHNKGRIRQKSTP